MAQLKKKTMAETYHHDRGWGHEKWIENLPEYCGKILHVNAGKRGSLHFHINKLETMLLISGRVDLRLIDPEKGTEYVVELRPRDSILIPRGQVHQIIGVEESEIVEFSTIHEETDSHRVQKGD
jgi:oxalate decarboxylase/phosphoglucose isomerase-like protein (cupin superfamily)